MRLTISILCVCSMLPLSVAVGADEPAPPYSSVHALFVQHCLGCHNSTDAEGGLVLVDHASALKGGDNGAAIVPGKANESLLVKLIEHSAKPVMPPVKKGAKLKAEEIAIIRAWIDAGAAAPKAGEVLITSIPRPKIPPKVKPRESIQALAYSPQLKRLAIARPDAVQIMSIEDRTITHTLTGHQGKVNDLAISSDGMILAAGAGLPGELGEVRLWNLKDGKLIRALQGHRDAIYAVALSPDGSLLATGSYDQKIMLWNTAESAPTSPVRTLQGHNGAVFDLAFRAGGKVLASVSADRTMKLWDVATGERLDTRSESMQALHAVVFSSKGDRVFAAGVDNRIRMWSISASAKEGGNTLLQSRFAHDGAILNLALSADGRLLISAADDRTVKLWNADDLSPILLLEKQSDWPAAVASINEGKAIAVGRLDGGLAFYDAKSGDELPPPKPELLVSAIPTGVQRGVGREIPVSGKHLTFAETVRSSDARIKGIVRNDSPGGTSAMLVIDTPDDLPRGNYDIWLANRGGESAKLKLLIDDLAQAGEIEPNDLPSSATSLTLPASAWGTISERGDTDHYAFTGKAGQAIIIDAMCARLSGKADLVIELHGPDGRIVAGNNDFDGSPDPFIATVLPADGRYTVAVRDLQLAASKEHVYRLSIGELPMVTGIYPQVAKEDAQATLELIGFNLAGKNSVILPVVNGSEMMVPLDANLYRSRRELKVTSTNYPPDLEQEPNDDPAHAMQMLIPSVMNGRIDRAAGGGRAGDADYFQITARKGQRLILETNAARLGSPVDTKIEVLHAEKSRVGEPVIRTRLRAVRDTSHTFRPIDANANGTRLVNWEEMQQNELLYMQGEVVKLFLPPRGPDSQWDFYTLGGKRRCYFDTSAAAHALDEPCYIVEPLAPDGATPPGNGLPIFSVPYANDDDQERLLGSDSRLHFEAPADGDYLVRITDARGFGGADHVYALTIREARPDYRVVMLGANPTVPAGSGVTFTASATRMDGFEGPITVNITGLPPGFIVSSPLIIEAGHNEAKGVIFALPDSPAPTTENQSITQVKTHALIDGIEAARDANNLGTIKLGPKPKLLTTLTPEPMPAAVDANAPMEITIMPGQTTTARIKLERNGHDDLASFDVENLPHGVIVADLGLNGLLIRADENERVIFITCAPWVQEMDRLCHARANQAGNPTSKPVLLKVRRK